MKQFRIILWFLVIIAIGVIVYDILANKYSDKKIPISAETPAAEKAKPAIADKIEGIYIHPPMALPSHQLISSAGNWDANDWLGHWNLAYFGFTSCPDVCPAALGLMSYTIPKVEAKIPPAEFARLRGVMVTVDPWRDTPEMLDGFVKFYHPDFMGLSGKLAQIDILAKKFGVYYDYPDGTDTTTNYQVGHSSTIILINPDGKFQAVLTEHSDGEKLAKDIAAIINYWSSQQ